MEIKFFIGFLSALAITLFSTFKFFKHSKNEQFDDHPKYLAFIGFVYLTLMSLSFLWFFEFLNYSPDDFVFIFSFLMVLQGIFVFMIVSPILENRLLLYFLGFYVFLFFITFFMPPFFMKLFIATHFLFFLLLSINFIFRKDDYKSFGTVGTSCSALSIIIYSIFLAISGDIYIYVIIFNFLFFLTLYSVVDSIEKNPLKHKRKKEINKNYVFDFLSHFTFVLVIVNFVLIGTIVLHEFGHLLTSNFYDCPSGKIVYENGLPRTEILCSNVDNTFYVLIGGVMLPILLAITLFLIGGRFLREIGLLIIGFNLIAATRDLSEIGLSDNQITFFVILGIIMCALGVVFMAKTKTEDYLIQTDSLI